MYYCMDCTKDFNHRKLIYDDDGNIKAAVCPHCDSDRTCKV